MIIIIIIININKKRQNKYKLELQIITEINFLLKYDKFIYKIYSFEKIIKTL